jgi:hydrogenase nickel incorporation protein HypA/HybF
MHEYSLAQSLLERVEREAQARHATQVRSVTLRIGELAGVEIALLATAYAVCRDGTMCRDARLKIEAEPARWGCPQCGGDVPHGAPLRCATCGVPARLAAGGELLLQSIEMEVP